MTRLMWFRRIQRPNLHWATRDMEIRTQIHDQFRFESAILMSELLKRVGHLEILHLNLFIGRVL